MYILARTRSRFPWFTDLLMRKHELTRRALQRAAISDEELERAFAGFERWTEREGGVVRDPRDDDMIDFWEVDIPRFLIENRIPGWSEDTLHDALILFAITRAVAKLENGEEDAAFSLFYQGHTVGDRKAEAARIEEEQLSCCVSTHQTLQ